MTYRPSLVAAALALATAVLASCASVTDGSPTAAAPSVSSPPPSHVSPPTRASTPRPTAPSTPSTPASRSTSTHPVPSSPLETKTVTASDGTVYAISIWAEQTVADCAAHAYGEVAQFLATHSCNGIRQLLATTAINGRAVGFAQSSLGFGGGMNVSYKAAGQFRDLVTADGTGNVDDLLREGYRLPAGPDHVPSPDAFDALGQDAGVVVTDAWYLDGATPANDPPLVKMEQDIFLQF